MLADSLPRATCRLVPSKATMFMKRRTVTGRTGGKTGGRQKLKLLKKSKLLVAWWLGTLFSRNCSRSDYIYENTSSYEKFVKKQGKVKLLKINELKSRGSAVRRKKMLKMQDDPTMCMKTQGRATECPSTKSHFFDQIGAVLTIIMDGFRALRERSLEGGRSNTELSPPSVRGILRPAEIGRKRFVCASALNHLEASKCVLLRDFSL